MTAAYDAALYWAAEKEETERKLAADATMAMLQKIAEDTSEREFLLDFFDREFTKLAPLYASDAAQYQVLMKLDPSHQEFYKTFIKEC